MDSTNTAQKVTIADRAMVDVFDQIDEMEKARRPKLREDLFLRDWLSFFLGLDTTETADSKRVLWQKITGNLPTRVDIIDTARNTIAVIPTVFSSEIIDSTKVNNDTYAGLFKTYAVLARRAIPEGDRWMKIQREAITQKIFRQFGDTALAGEWRALFDHYEKEVTALLKEYGKQYKPSDEARIERINQTIDGYDEI